MQNNRHLSVSVLFPCYFVFLSKLSDTFLQVFHALLLLSHFEQLFFYIFDSMFIPIFLLLLNMSFDHLYRSLHRNFILLSRLSPQNVCKRIYALKYDKRDCNQISTVILVVQKQYDKTNER